MTCDRGERGDVDVCSILKLSVVNMCESVRSFFKASWIGGERCVLLHNVQPTVKARVRSRRINGRFLQSEVDGVNACIKSCQL